MIAFLQGVSAHVGEKSLILNVHGVGYEVFVSSDVLANIAEGSDISLFTHAIYREDEAALYGFDTLERRDLFRVLLTVNGVGAKMGMELMSLPSDKLQTAIANGDEAYLTMVKGVGAKLASRLILELKNKVTSSQLSEVSGQQSGDPALEDAVVALERLGYDRKQIRKALSHMPGDITATEDVVRWGLQNL